MKQTGTRDLSLEVPKASTIRRDIPPPPILKPNSPVFSSRTSDVEDLSPPILSPIFRPQTSQLYQWGDTTGHTSKPLKKISLVDREDMRRRHRTGIIMRFRRCRSLRQAKREDSIRKLAIKLMKLQKKLSGLVLKSLDRGQTRKKRLKIKQREEAMEESNVPSISGQQGRKCSVDSGVVVSVDGDD